VTIHGPPANDPRPTTPGQRPPQPGSSQRAGYIHQPPPANGRSQPSPSRRPGCSHPGPKRQRRGSKPRSSLLLMGMPASFPPRPPVCVDPAADPRTPVPTPRTQRRASIAAPRWATVTSRLIKASPSARSSTKRIAPALNFLSRASFSSTSAVVMATGSRSGRS